MRGFERVFLEGFSITLFGDGYLDLNGGHPRIDPTLRLRFGQVRDHVPLVSDDLGTAGERIRVEGSLSVRYSAGVTS